MAVDMFMKIGDLKGESKDFKHKEAIDVLAWSWGMSQSGTSHTGGGGGAGKVSIQDISVTKYVDKGSAALMMHCATGKHINNGMLYVRKAGEKPLEYIKIKIEDILVSSVSTGGSGGEDRLTENVTLNFAKVKIDYKEQAKDGSAAATPSSGWDIEANVKL